MGLAAGHPTSQAWAGLLRDPCRVVLPASPDRIGFLRTEPGEYDSGRTLYFVSAELAKRMGPRPRGLRIGALLEVPMEA